LRKEQAEELGLEAGTSVFGGGGDASLIGVGAGCVKAGETHIYCGTSGWVSTIVEKQIVDPNYMIASIIGAQSDKFNYFAEMETAGKSLEWVKDHLALDEIGVYLNKEEITGDKETVYTSLYDYMSAVIDKCPPGSGGVIFTPWLHGNRCPFEDHNASGIFFNISLETGKTEMIRAVTEGVCFHLRWMLECQDKKIKTSKRIRFVGGGALSKVTCQILADITGRVIETVDSPQNVGSAGAALTAAVGMGILDDMESIGNLIPVKETYKPRKEYKKVYDRNYKVFKSLYRSNKRNFSMINSKK
ncbi:MAG: carbohydrate kinase, partial [Firmicutes bacterium]|nr:carbohydrate kinase [Bacillota bacterium]